MHKILIVYFDVMQYNNLCMYFYVYVNCEFSIRTCRVYLAVYNVLCLCISAPLSEARCSKNSDKGLSIRSPPKQSIHPCMHCF